MIILYKDNQEYPPSREEKNFHIVTCCSLCCLDCHWHTGKIPDPARDLRKELRQVQYEKCADALSKVRGADPLNITSRCYDLPGAMVKFRCKKRIQGGVWSAILPDQEAAARKKRSWAAGNAVSRTCKKLTFPVPVQVIHISGTSMRDGRKGSMVLFPEKGAGNPVRITGNAKRA